MGEIMMDPTKIQTWVPEFFSQMLYLLFLSYVPVLLYQLSIQTGLTVTKT